jgi:hypothetical protein
MGERKVVNTVWRGNLRKLDHLENPGVNGRVILRWIFKTLDGASTGLIWFRISTSGGHL